MSGHRFSTTWGALPLAGGGARFHLWAPAMVAVKLRESASGREIAMQRHDDGWFRLETDAVPVGGGYAYVLDDGSRVPDPASREQMGDVHGPSRLVDPADHPWRCTGWRGRPWEQTVIYELHTGAFTHLGTFDGVEQKLDHLAQLGATALELMPIAQFAGERGWGYDGVLPYAPHRAYGGVHGLKHLVDSAHERGLMVFLDVVYNHFGPEGNYLGLYAPEFFHPGEATPWGAALAYEREPVAAFFIENALYWLEEYQLDGLRLDAIDQIRGPAGDRMLRDLARRVRSEITDRHVHLTTEDERNIVTLHERNASGRPRLYSGEWNDDFHHACHVLATGDDEGYYQDFVSDPLGKLARALGEGYVYQGETSLHRGRSRGEPSKSLPSTAFIDFLQNHDQIGNRAYGDRLTDLATTAAVEALTAILLLSPAIPLLFMGEEWGETRPFSFFTDYEGDLAEAVRAGRRAEFKAWASFSAPEARALIPDPNAPETFLSSRLDWDRIAEEEHQRRLSYVRNLLDLRQRRIVPHMQPPGPTCLEHLTFDGGTFCVRWTMSDGVVLALHANLDDQSWSMPQASNPDAPDEHLVFEIGPGVDRSLRAGELPGWSVVFRLDESRGRR